jgi:hypothetical protein
MKIEKNIEGTIDLTKFLIGLVGLILLHMIDDSNLNIYVFISIAILKFAALFLLIRGVRLGKSDEDIKDV